MRPANREDEFETSTLVHQQSSLVKPNTTVLMKPKTEFILPQ
jgi:hypothetical protein